MFGSAKPKKSYAPRNRHNPKYRSKVIVRDTKELEYKKKWSWRTAEEYIEIIEAKRAEGKYKTPKGWRSVAVMIYATPALRLIKNLLVEIEYLHRKLEELIPPDDFPDYTKDWEWRMWAIEEIMQEYPRL